MALPALIGTHSARTRIFPRYQATVEKLMEEQSGPSDQSSVKTTRAYVKYEAIFEVLLGKIVDWAVHDNAPSSPKPSTGLSMMSLDMKHWQAWDSVPRLAMSWIDQHARRLRTEILGSDLAERRADELGTSTNDIPSYSSDPEQILLMREELSEQSEYARELTLKVQEVLSGLADQQRKVFVLHVEGHSRREIAAELRIGEYTVSTHLERAKEKIARWRKNQSPDKREPE